MATSEAKFKAWRDIMMAGALSLTIPLNPVPAARPKLGGRHAYYPKNYAQYKRQAQLYLPQEDVPFWPNKRQKLFVATEFIVQKARTSKLLTPRGDLDNFVKAAWDAVTTCGATWVDDDQVVMSFELKRFAEIGEEPRTELLILPL